jgi:WD40 repeat protein
MQRFHFLIIVGVFSISASVTPAQDAKTWRAGVARINITPEKLMWMSGYGARVRSLDFTADGKWLATSGATQLILWPFHGKDGPMGKAPRMFAPAEFPVEIVACQRKDDVVAAGYADGLVLLVRVEDGTEVLAKPPGTAPITALCWNAGGDTLAFGTDDGDAGIVDLG